MDKDKKQLEKDQENKADEKVEDTEPEDTTDYKELYQKTLAERDTLTEVLKEHKKFKREVEKAERKQLEEKVKTYFPDLDITQKHSDDYLKGLLKAAQRFKMDEKEEEEELHIPDKGEPISPTKTMSKEKKLIHKLLNG